jgi:histidinol phosphatase-like enzyme
VDKPQTFKRTISKHLNLKVRWRNKQFIAIINSGVIRNYITPKIVEQLRLLYRQKLKPYTLVTISGELVPYRDGIINLKTGLV